MIDGRLETWPRTSGSEHPPPPYSLIPFFPNSLFMGRKYDQKSLREKKIDFRRHARTYLVMSGFFLVLNLFLSGTIGWAVWPIFGWGIGVTMQALSLYGPLADPDDAHPTEERRERKRDRRQSEHDERLELRDLDREAPPEPAGGRSYREEDLV